MNLFIIVIYSKDICLCSTITSLLNIDPLYLKNVGLYFYINGKEDFGPQLKTAFGKKCMNVWTCYDGKNVGIVKAYQKAITQVGEKFDWITLLDQDSKIDNRFIKAITNLSSSRMIKNEVAVAPIVKANNDIILSPTKNFLGRSFSFKSKFGYPTCINSLSTFKSEFLLQMAPRFPIDFFLDAFDNWLFYRMYKLKLSFAVLDDVEVFHNISLLNPVINDVYWAREMMFLINTCRISIINFPLTFLRFFWRLFRVIIKTGNIRCLNLVDIYRKYNRLKEDLNNK